MKTITAFQDAMHKLGINLDNDPQYAELPNHEPTLCGKFHCLSPSGTRFPIPCRRKYCEKCQGFKAERFTNQVWHESNEQGYNLHVINIDSRDKKAFFARMRRHTKKTGVKHVYLCLPLPDETCDIITDFEQGDDFSRDFHQVKKWIKEHLKVDEDTSHRTSSSKGFGGPYAGAHMASDGKYPVLRKSAQQTRKHLHQMASDKQARADFIHAQETTKSAIIEGTAKSKSDDFAIPLDALGMSNYEFADSLNDSD